MSHNVRLDDEVLGYYIVVKNKTCIPIKTYSHLDFSLYPEPNGFVCCDNCGRVIRSSGSAEYVGNKLCLCCFDNEGLSNES